MGLVVWRSAKRQSVLYTTFEKKQDIRRKKCGAEAGGTPVKRQRSWKEYRAIDLALLGAALAVFEFLIVQASNRWFPDQPFTVSLAAAVTAIVYMRWGPWGAVHTVEAGLVFCYFSGATGEQYLIYCVGNLLSLAVVPLMYKVGKERVRTGWLALVIPALVWALMAAGRGLMALLLGKGPAAAIGFFTTDSLSLLFTLVIVWIAKRLDGIYEDQKHYLLRVNSAEKEKEAKYES